MTRVRVDRSRCEGHSMCNALVPEVFELDDDGIAAVVLADIPAELRDRMAAAVGSCPAAAIILASGA